jgi:FAD:protein FMN transferase
VIVRASSKRLASVAVTAAIVVAFATRGDAGPNGWGHSGIGSGSSGSATPAPDRGSAAEAGAGSAAPAAPGKLNYSDTAMGTYVTVWFWTADQLGASKAAAEVFAEMHRLDMMMTTWKPDSEISRINTAAGDKPVRVGDETIAVIQRAVDVSKRSGGVFDITVGAFKGLWKFDEDMDQDCQKGEQSCQLPDAKAVKERLKLVGWKDIVIDAKAKTVFLRRKGMSITLGGIAKGYAVDKCVAILRARGFTDFMVQAGGDMYVAGSKGKDPWVVGIRDPRGPRDSMFALSPIREHSFSTSGDYERGFVKDGVRYHHILDPRDGQPARTTRSVTIRAKDAFTADAWSKVMFIYGWQAGLAIIKREKLDDFDAVWVDDHNTIHVTPGIEHDLHIQKQPTPGP